MRERTRIEKVGMIGSQTLKVQVSLRFMNSKSLRVMKWRSLTVSSNAAVYSQMEESLRTGCGQLFASAQWRASG
jgi:hypothetical protein